MEKESTTPFNDCINELIDPRPLGIAKIIAAWDGLSIETKIQIYKKVKEISLGPHLLDKLQQKALKDENEYIRYLVRKDISGEEFARIVVNESSELVKYSTRKTLLGEEYKDPKKFYSMPHFERLALLTNEVDHGEYIAKCISFAFDKLLPKKKINENEIFELLYEYIGKPEFKDNYSKETRDGYFEYMKGKDLEELWKLTINTNTPKLFQYYLLKLLPLPWDMEYKIEPIIRQIDNENIIGYFFERKDIGSYRLRRELFFEDDKKYESASWWNFDLYPDEMDKIMDDAIKNKSSTKIQNLACLASDLSLVNYMILDDILGRVIDFSPMSSDFEYGEFAQRKFYRKLKELSGKQREKQILDLRLYCLAKKIKPWKGDGYKLDEKLDFLEGSIKENTLKTYIELRNKWNYTGTKKSEDDLPRIDELDEEEIYLDYYDEDSEPVSEFSIVKEQTEKIKNILEGMSEDRDSELQYENVFLEITGLINKCHSELKENIDNQYKKIESIAKSTEKLGFIIKILLFGFIIYIIYIIFS